jgi:hypothetical protein
MNSRACDVINGPWGDKIENKPNDTFRYGFVNINGLPLMAKHEKHDQILHAISKYKIDLLRLAEININYKQVSATNQWMDRFKKLQTNKHCATNHHTTSQDKRVFGGTAYLSSPSASHKIEARGDDPTCLGCWTWALLSGKHGIKTRIVAGYRPVHDYSNRAGSVFSQHKKYFTDQGEPWDP